MDGEPAQAVWGYEWVSNPVIWEWGGARPRKQDGSIPAMPGQRSRKYFESFKFKGREGEGAMTPAGWFCRNVLILPGYHQLADWGELDRKGKYNSDTLSYTQ